MTDGQLMTLPAQRLHREAGAQLMTLANWAIPAHYGDPEGEYRAGREGVALMDVSFLSKVSATGKDHIEYLNRRTSQRVIDQQVGEGQRANQLNAEGRMEADFAFFRATGELSFLIAPPAVGGTYLQQLMDKYVFTEDAQFEDRTDQWAAFALFGPQGDKVLRDLLPPGRQIAPLRIADAEGYVFTAEFMVGGLIIMVPAGNAGAVFECLRARTEEQEGRLLGFVAFDTLRVEAGQPWWGIDLTDRAIPLEADLMSAIHTNKGCYPGQETIAKVLNLGHPARKLVGVMWDSEDPPPPGVSIQSGDREAGTLTSSTYSPRLKKAIGMAMVRWNFRADGTPLTAPDGQRGVVHALPFE